MGERILIIGGGLSGLHTAYELARRDLDFLLVEGRGRLGGRILSQGSGDGYDAASGGFDLGPAWFWPGQERMHRLIHQLGLELSVVDQFADGDQLVESGPGRVARGRFGVTMAGSFRLRGGMRQLIERLARELPDSKIRRSTRATSLALRPDGVELTVDGGERLLGDRAVLAMPPRVALSSLDFEPELPAERRAQLHSLPTWMASSGKFVAIYERAFWREAGLSGDAVSYVGPLGEIHDVTPTDSLAESTADSPDESTAALFGFFGIPPAARKTSAKALERACLAQLTRLFGDAAAAARKTWLKDWAFDAWTATADDLVGPAVHSLIGLEQPNEPSWHDRLLWSGSETASTGERNNGYLEGALESSWRTIELLSKLDPSP